MKQRDQLAAESNAFMCSGTHIVQKDCLPSALNTFVEAVTRCDPPIHARRIFRHFAFLSDPPLHYILMNLVMIK